MLIFQVCHATGRDVTRTMGTHRAAVQIAHVLGALSGPLLYRYLGFYGVFPLVLLLQVFLFITRWLHFLSYCVPTWLYKYLWKWYPMFSS